MEPVKTRACNIVYKGPSEEIGDLSCRRVAPGEIASYWHPSPDELNVLRQGGHVELTILGEPIPPVAVNVVPADPPGAR